jgi:hypothetical protein
VVQLEHEPDLAVANPGEFLIMQLGEVPSVEPEGPTTTRDRPRSIFSVIPLSTLTAPGSPGRP